MAANSVVEIARNDIRVHDDEANAAYAAESAASGGCRETIGITAVYMHPEWVANCGRYDIAIVEMETIPKCANPNDALYNQAMVAKVDGVDNSESLVRSLHPSPPHAHAPRDPRTDPIAPGLWSAWT